MTYGQQRGKTMNITTARQFLVAVAALCLCAWANADTYTYDNLNRLTLVQYASGASLAYSYDPAGNRLSSTSIPALVAQTISFGSAPTVHVGGTGTVSATATSGLPVSLSSSPPSVCTLTGSLVVGVGVGICTITATQAGDAVYASAAPVLQAFSVTAVLTVPGAPSIASINAGPGRVTLTLQPPGNTGGGPITTYSATCSAIDHPSVTANSATTTVIVPGLVPGVSYTCTATANNGSYTSLATPASAPVIPKPKADLTPILMLLLD